MQSVLIHPTYSCNLSCGYCVNQVRSGDYLDIEHVRNLLESLVQRNPGEDISVRWTGGEPLLAGVEFFEEAFAIQDALPARFENKLSSNLQVVPRDPRWLRLIVDRMSAVNTSVDDPVDGLGLYRPAGSQAQTLRAIRMLLDAGLPGVTVRTTVTDRNVASLPDLYRMFKGMPGVVWDFNPIIPDGVGSAADMASFPDSATFVSSAVEVFRLWLADPNPPRVTIFDQLVAWMLGDSLYTKEGKPGLAMGADGHLYFCGSLLGSREHDLGEVSRESLERTDALRCSGGVSTPEPCLTCDFKTLCGMGSCRWFANIRDRDNGFYESFCAAMKPFLTVVRESVEQQLEQAATPPPGGPNGHAEVRQHDA